MGLISQPRAAATQRLTRERVSNAFSKSSRAQRQSLREGGGARSVGSIADFLGSSLPQGRPQQSFNSMGSLTGEQRKHLAGSAQQSIEQFLGPDKRDEKHLYRKSLEFDVTGSTEGWLRAEPLGEEGELEEESPAPAPAPAAKAAPVVSAAPSGGAVNGLTARRRQRRQQPVLAQVPAAQPSGRTFRLSSRPAQPVQASASDRGGLLQSVVDHLRRKKKVPSL